MGDHGRVTWSAPLAPGPVHGVVAVPGSKSVTNRALLLAALSGGPATVAGAPASRDTALMVGALRALGVPIEVDGERVAVGAHDGLRGGGTVDCGLAGTVMRFVPPAAALADGPVALRRRPARPRTPAGHRARRPARARRPRRRRRACRSPCTAPAGSPGGEVVIDASASSQFVSGLLLSGARYDKGVTVHHDGKPVPSLPHIDMTRRDAARGGRRRRRRRARTPGGSRPAPIAGARLGRRARPVQRRGVPRRGRGHRRAGHGRGLARGARPSPAPRSCRCWRECGLRGRARAPTG